MKAVIAILAAVLLALMAWWAFDERSEPASASGGAATAQRTSQRSASSASGARGTAPMRSPMWTRPDPNAKPTLFGEFLRAKSYRALYDRLNGTAEGSTSEGKLVMYEILKACTSAGQRTSWRGSVPGRDFFMASIAATDPQRDRRIAAYESFVVDKCAGLELTATTAGLMKLLEEAAAMGDPKARAIAMEQQLLQSRRERTDGQVTLSDEQVRTLQSLAGTRDPEAVRAVGRVLSTGWSDYGLRIDGDPAPIEPRPFMNAWLVLACEYGASCGGETPRMQQLCAMQGYCDAEAWPDLLFHYLASPHDAQRTLQYRNVLRAALDTGDWSRLVVVRGADSAAHRVTFAPGPR